MKKYEFTGEEKIFNGRTVRRIRRISDGVIGGWIESESNLSHIGSCFVYDGAIVCYKAFVCQSAVVRDYAVVCDSAFVSGTAVVCDEAFVSENALVCDDAFVNGKVFLNGNARVSSICTETPVCIADLRYIITISDATITWGCREFDWISINQFKFEDCTTKWDRQEFEDTKKLIIAAAKLKWGIE